MAKSILSVWQRLVGLLELDKKDILQTIYYAIFAGLVNLSLPLGIQAIINLIQGAQVSTSWIVLVVLVTLGVAFVGILQLMQIRIIENIQQRIFTRASFEFAYRFPRMKMSELRNYYPPELANRFFDTLTVQKGLSKILLDFPAALLQIIFGLLLLSFYHPFFIIYGLLLLLLVYIVFKFTAQKGLETSLDESKNKYKVAHWIQEVARSVISFKIAGDSNLALQKNDVLVSKYLGAREGHFRILVFQYIQMIGFKVLVTAGLLLIGGILVFNQEMNIGQFVAAEIIILLVISSVEKLIIGLETLYDVLTSLEKLGQVVDRDLEVKKNEGIRHRQQFHVELENVSYSVPERKKKILRNISMDITHHSRIVIQGSGGAGKTTLLKIISGLIKPTDGTMLVNGQSIQSISLIEYRSLIGLSLKEETPFEGSILENITFGDPNVPRDDVDWAVDVMGLSNFIVEQPEGIHTIVYPEGKRLSDTISRRILLARAIVRKPRLLVLKDPIELFEEPEAIRLMDFLTDSAHPWGLVVVSQHPLWSQRCNQIILIEDGRTRTLK